MPDSELDKKQFYQQLTSGPEKQGGTYAAGTKYEV